MPTETYRIEGMDCADCALQIEQGVEKLEGVARARVNFSTAVLEVEGSAPAETIRQRVELLGYRLADPAAPRRKKPGLLAHMLQQPEARVLLAGAVLFGLGLLADGLLAGIPWLGMGLQLAALAVAGYPILRSGAVNLWVNRTFNINLLTGLAAIGAALIGEITEAATLILLFSLAEMLEDYATDHSRRALDDLSTLLPEQAVRLTETGEELVPVSALRVADRLLIRPGERVPMDGEVLAGESEINQAAITGESLPAFKSPGAQVYAGTVNGSGALEIRVTRPAEENVLGRIIRLAAEAQAKRAPTERIIDRFARYYTPAVVMLAVLVAALPPLLAGAPFLDPAPGERGWLYRALALLVISCPCALVISAPVSILSGITAAARRGVLIKGGAAMESLGRLRFLAFDKTGTLTRGLPVVTMHTRVDCDYPNCAACDDVLALASAVERRSTHPLAHAVVSAAGERGVLDAYPPAEGVQVLAGLGLQGEVNGSTVTVGSHRLFHDSPAHSPAACRIATQAEENGETAMLIHNGDQVCGVIAAADEIRPESAAVIGELHRLGCRTALLTGDHAAAAQRVADVLGMDDVRAGLLPAEKLAAIRRLAEQPGGAAMVGDGINDAPALAAATVGIAMGGAASAQAMDTADVVLMADGLGQLPGAVRLSRRVRAIITQNIAFTLAVKLGFVALAMAGITTLWLAVLADTGVTLVVIANGMRPVLGRGKN